MLLGISGKIKSGKDLSAKIIILIHEYYAVMKDSNESFPEFIIKKLDEDKDFNYDLFWNRIAFGDSLKKVVSIITKCDINNLYSHTFKNSNSNILNPSTNTAYTYRELLQQIGGVMRDFISPNIWVTSALYNRFSEDTIVTDVRFLNEAQAIKDLGGILIRINRDTPNLDRHISETDLDQYGQFDYIVDNNKSISDLILQLIEIMKKEKLI